MHQTEIDEKIPNPDLRRLAAQDTKETISVLIEVDLPQHRVEFGRTSGTGFTVPTSFEPMTEEERASMEQQVAEVTRFLEQLLGTTPKWLRSSYSFLALVTPAQLREIAHFPRIKAIWPNRTLKRLSSRNAGK